LSKFGSNVNTKSSIWLPSILFVTASLAQAQQAVRVPRIGYLSASSASEVSPRADAFRQGLRELGYVQGENLVIEFRYAEGKFDNLPAWLPN
jgi:putative tryptophan/tyrosine transport system substrate-binding protein